MTPSRRLPARAARRDLFLLVGVSVTFVCVAAVGLVLASENTRLVLAPAATSVSVALLYFCVVTARERELPVFEIATFFVAATTIYTIVPLLQFTAINFSYGIYSDWRLWYWAPTPREFGGFAWRHVLLLASYVFTYLLLRKRSRGPLPPVRRPAPAAFTVLVLGVLALTAYVVGLHLYVKPVSPYAGGTGAEYLRLPHFVRQITNIILASLLIFKQALVIALLLRWRERAYRFALMAWLFIETALVVAAGESRTLAVLLLLTFVVGYHRLVKPLRVKLAATVGGAVLVFILLFGLVRDVGTSGLIEDRRAAWGAANEFQVLFGTAYDIHARKTMQMLPPQPPFLFLVDVYRLIPSQFLPFYKWDPAEWYLEVLGIRGSGIGLMFGIVAQGVMGYDWIELALRGMLLALMHAVAHRLYRRYGFSFWATITYLFILSWVYFAFRSTSFEVLYRLVFYLAPSIVAVKLLTYLLSRATRRTVHRPAATPAMPV